MGTLSRTLGSQSHRSICISLWMEFDHSSLWYGVPIVTWPLYAEQHINVFQLVRDLEVAIELTLNYRMHDSDHCEIMKAEEIEKVIRCIMENENPLRRRVKDMGEISRKALTEGRSSFISLG
ncbi:hypothetical protein RDI58_018096 [Solanum bulbocastanum]|uniref:Uncharacterized protein n=1 Tax=Solanum bulbocastanum TaxID=147425 RepID=A0AAN8TIX7_SOLBU